MNFNDLYTLVEEQQNNIYLVVKRHAPANTSVFVVIAKDSNSGYNLASEFIRKQYSPVRSRSEEFFERACQFIAWRIGIANFGLPEIVAGGQYFENTTKTFIENWHQLLNWKDAGTKLFITKNAYRDIRWCVLKGAPEAVERWSLGKVDPRVLTITFSVTAGLDPTKDLPDDLKEDWRSAVVEYEAPEDKKSASDLLDSLD